MNAPSAFAGRAVLRLAHASFTVAVGLVVAATPVVTRAEPPTGSPNSAGAVVAAGAQPAINVQTLEKGSSSKSSRTRAAQALPWNRLTSQHSQQVQEIVQNTGLFRRLPKIRCEVDHRVYNYFMDHPDVGVAIWRAMGVSTMQMTQTGTQSYRSDMGDGTVGSIEILLRTPESSIAICDGTFNCPLLTKPIRARGMLHLTATYEKQPDGREFVVHQGDMFVWFPSQTIETAAKVISPMTNKIADKNFEEVTLFVRMMDAVMVLQPQWVEEIAPQLRELVPGRDEQLLKLTAAVHKDSGPRRVSLQRVVDR